MDRVHIVAGQQGARCIAIAAGVVAGGVGEVDRKRQQCRSRLIPFEDLPLFRSGVGRLGRALLAGLGLAFEFVFEVVKPCHRGFLVAGQRGFRHRNRELIRRFGRSGGCRG